MVADPKCASASSTRGIAGGAGIFDVNGDNRALKSSVVKTQPITCGYADFVFDPKVRIANGYAVGVVGSTFHSPDDNEFISDVRLACTPWSSAPWVYNWGDMRFSFSEAFNTDGTTYIPDRFSPYRYFWRVLNDSFVIETEDYWRDYEYTHLPPNNSSTDSHAWVRPVHFQTCPPNYAMNGLVVKTTEYDGEFLNLADPNDIPAKLIKGIHALNCVPIPYLPGAEEIQIRLTPSTPDDFRYRYAGSTVDVGNHIGRTYDAIGEESLLRCPDGDGIHSVTTDHPSYSPSYRTYLSFGCIQLPFVP